MSVPNQNAGRQQDERALPVSAWQLWLAVLGHLLVGALLVFGVQCSPKPPEEVIIQAVLLEQPVEGEKPVTVEEAPKPKPPEPKPPEPEPVKPKPPEPVPEPPKPLPPKPEPPKVDPEKLKQQAEVAEKKRVEELLKLEQQQLLAKQQAEEKVRQAAEKAKADAEAKAAEEEARKAALDAEQKRLAAIEDAKRKEAEAAENKRKAEDKARQEALARQIAADEAARMAAIRADSQKLWVRALADAIRRNWLRPPGADTFSCKLNVQLLPNGQVVSARIISSCGSPILDDSVIKAVYKASPLPLPSEPSAFVPDLNLTFKP